MNASVFTSIRLFSGAITLLLLICIVQRQLTFPTLKEKKTIKGGIFLFAYAALFSYAYVLLDTATGALILFATVQFTMMSYQVIAQRSLQKNELIGTLLALAGFSYWMWPDQSQPNLFGIILMAISGIAWGLYTINGKGSQEPHLDTAKNFLFTIPLLLLLLPLMANESIEPSMNSTSIILAICSGAITSALGYWAWYSVLPQLKIAMASVLQLTVPIIATIGGIIWVSEWPDSDFYVACILILVGIFMVNRPVKSQKPA